LTTLILKADGKIYLHVFSGQWTFDINTSNKKESSKSKGNFNVKIREDFDSEKALQTFLCIYKT